MYANTVFNLLLVLVVAPYFRVIHTDRPPTHKTLTANVSSRSALEMRKKNKTKEKHVFAFNG